MKDGTTMKGQVTATVFTPDGEVKRHPKSFFRKLFRMKGKKMVTVIHNIVTNQGDALIADAMADTQARTAVNNANGEITVGTGFVSEDKTKTGVTTPTGSAQGMEATYPKLKGAFGATDDNVTQYRAIFAPGSLNANGINETAIGNGTDNLAYAELTPSVNVTLADTLQIDWEITFVGV